MRVNSFINNGNKIINLSIGKPGALASLLNQLISFVFRPRTDEQVSEIGLNRFIQFKRETNIGN